MGTKILFLVAWVAFVIALAYESAVAAIVVFLAGLIATYILGIRHGRE